MARKGNEWFRPLIESTAEPITVVSAASGRFIDVNAAFLRSTGFERAEVLSKTPTELGLLDDRAAYDRLLADHSLTDLTELEFHTRERGSRIAQISRLAIEVAGQACFILIWRDITERRQFESDLLRARDLALESAQLKSNFLSTVSHELRTPLNGIIGMSELLSATELTAEQYEYADTIERSSRTLLKLVTDILDFSKASNGHLHVETIGFNLPQVIEAAVSQYRGLAAAKGLELTCSVDPSLASEQRGDPHRLGQVLSNLLNNAIKFTDLGAVAVRVVPVKRDGDSTVARFEVHDTGIGIKPADQERIFQPFIQADGSQTRKYGGTGLGLSICSELVNLMSGEIGVSSILGRGSVFHFTARFGRARADSDQGDLVAAGDTPETAAATTESAKESERDARADRGLHILTVEDNTVNEIVLRRQLDKLGYALVTTAKDGRQAVEILAKTPHDVVLMDCEMPVMDGIEATLLIRQQEGENRRTRIIAVTAKAMQEDYEQCIASGMDDYLAKPIRLEELAAALERCSEEKLDSNRIGAIG